MKSLKIFFAISGLLLVLNMAYIFKNPFGSETPDPLLKYLIAYVFGVGILSFLYRKKITMFSQKMPAILRFLILSSILVIIEELTIYFFKTGIFEGGTVKLLDGLKTTVPSLFLWSVGILIVIRRYQYNSWQLFLLAAISGWINEMIVVPDVLPGFFITFFLFPSVAIPYVILIWLPYQTIKEDLTTTKSNKWKIPAAIFLPTFLFIIGAAFGQALVS